MEQNFLVDQFFKGGPMMWPMLLCSLIALLGASSNVVLWVWLVCVRAMGGRGVGLVWA